MSLQHPTRCVLLAAMTLAMGCHGRPAASTTPTEADHRAADANRLPAFDVEGDTVPPVSSKGIPYERFHVSLGDAPMRGPANAPVTIVMFSDFECPYCARGLETMNQLAARYGDQVRIAYKAYPLDFHENAFLAAMAARSAQAQGKFWDFHDSLFQVDDLNRAALETLAAEKGLDRTRLRRDLDELTFGREVMQDMRQGRRLGVWSTPSFFVNGRMVQGAQPAEEFGVLIDQELELARKWRQEGIEADGIYQHAISEGYRKVEYTKQRGLNPDEPQWVPVGTSPSKGPENAPVTVVVFGDFECPFCARGNQTIDALRQRYGDNIRLVYKHFPLPFHSHAFLAARASMAAHQQGKFWPYHDALYQREAHFKADDLDAIARALGLDMHKFKRTMNQTEFDASIVADQQLGHSLGVQGTPAYFINGRPLEGARPEWQFRLIIDEELARAKKLLDEGIDPSKLYETLTQKPLDDVE